MYLVVNEDGSIAAAVTNPDDGWKLVYDDEVGSFVVPMHRVKVVLDRVKRDEPYTAEFAILKDLGYSGTETAEKFAKWYAAEIVPLFARGQKIIAIKETRARYGIGLGEAKRYIDRTWPPVAV